MKTILLTSVITFVVFNTLAQDNFLKKYAAEYEIIVGDYSGYDREFYNLKPDGKATWIYKSGKTTQTKYGTWKASQDQIIVTINGNTGKIVEVFRFKKDRFVSEDSEQRYLHKKVE